MKPMFLSLAVALALLAGPPPARGALKVVTTTTDLGWFAREVGGDRVEVTVICKGYQDPHRVEPKPSYIVGLSRADLLIHVGLELEVGWLPKLLDGAHNPKIQEGQPGLLTPAGAVRILEKPQGPLDRTSGDAHPYGNPHYWLDPENGKAIASVIARRLADLDPEGADVYTRRSADLAARIDAKQREWKERLAPAKGMKLVTYHRTYSYLVSAFELDQVDFIEPKPGVPPSAPHLARLIQRVRSEGVKLLLIENFFDVRDAKFVASKTGVPVTVAPVSVEGVPGAKTWLDLMDILVSEIASAHRGR